MARQQRRKAGTSKGTRDEFPGVSSYKDRHGKVRWRYRLDGRTVNLGTEYGSPDFIRRYSAAVKGEPIKPVGGATDRVSQAPIGSLSHAIASWYKSAHFLGLGESTRLNYRRIAEHLREDYGKNMVADLTRGNVKAIMARHATEPEAANNRLRILRAVLDHAMEDMELIDHNPARGVKKLASNNPEGFHTWTEAEIARYFETHEEGTIADLAMALMLYTGAARSDAVQLGPKNIKDGRLQYRRQKMKKRGGVLVDIPLHPELARRLEALPEGQNTFLQTSTGKQRSANGLGNTMQKWTKDAGLVDCASHGLRKACARRLAEAGATPHEIMAVTGHKTLAEVERYTEKVARAGLADRAFKRTGD